MKLDREDKPFTKTNIIETFGWTIRIPSNIFMKSFYTGHYKNGVSRDYYIQTEWFIKNYNYRRNL